MKHITNITIQVIIIKPIMQIMQRIAEKAGSLARFAVSSSVNPRLNTMTPNRHTAAFAEDNPHMSTMNQATCHRIFTLHQDPLDLIAHIRDVTGNAGTTRQAPMMGVDPEVIRIQATILPTRPSLPIQVDKPGKIHIMGRTPVNGAKHPSCLERNSCSTIRNNNIRTWADR